MASASLWVGGESARTLPTPASLWPLQGLWLALHRVAKSITSSPFISMMFQEGLCLLQGHTGEGARMHPSALGWTLPPSAACSECSTPCSQVDARVCMCQIPGSSKPMANVGNWVKGAPAFQVIPGTQETGVVPLPGPGRSLGENEGRASTAGPKEGRPQLLHFAPQTLVSNRFPGPGAEAGRPPQEETGLKGRADTC